MLSKDATIVDICVRAPPAALAAAPDMPPLATIPPHIPEARFAAPRASSSLFALIS
jgi:hypothetical protein